MEQSLRTIVAKIAEISPDFPADAELRDGLQVDSVRALEILFEIERTLGIKVPEERYGEVRQFKDLVELVQSLKS